MNIENAHITQLYLFLYILAVSTLRELLELLQPQRGSRYEMAVREYRNMQRLVIMFGGYSNVRR